MSLLPWSYFFGQIIDAQNLAGYCFLCYLDSYYHLHCFLELLIEDLYIKSCFHLQDAVSVSIQKGPVDSYPFH